MSAQTDAIMCDCLVCDFAEMAGEKREAGRAYYCSCCGESFHTAKAHNWRMEPGFGHCDACRAKYPLAADLDMTPEEFAAHA